jgi:hypothetical protein
MAKTSEKVAASKQPESQRGKNRFDVQPRSNRVVLPDRPPREVDNEIVSILLGGDPASLTAQAPDETTLPLVEVAPLSSQAESTSSIQDPKREEKSANSQSTATSQLLATPFASSFEGRQATVTDSSARTSTDLESPVGRSMAKIKKAPSVPPRDISSRNVSLPQSDDGKSAITLAEHVPAQDMAISSFEEFAERWKHGLRKGQLKVCEVLYQKTYALGTAECITSFSELGRLSGLKMRQCFNIIAQLEALKFVERAKSESTSNKKAQGSIIRFFLFPKS